LLSLHEKTRQRDPINDRTRAFESAAYDIAYATAAPQVTASSRWLDGFRVHAIADPRSSSGNMLKHVQHIRAGYGRSVQARPVLAAHGCAGYIPELHLRDAAQNETTSLRFVSYIPRPLAHRLAYQR